MSTIHVGGYEPLARIANAEGAGHVVVLGNNSTHFLVGVHDPDRHAEDEVSVVMTFHYDGDNAGAIYGMAVARAVNEAVSR